MKRQDVVQLVALLGALVVAGYAAQRLLAGQLSGTGAWFVGSAVVHDLVLFPLYACSTPAWSRCSAAGQGWQRCVECPGSTTCGCR